jgi:hypothetical protein
MMALAVVTTAWMNAGSLGDLLYLERFLMAALRVVRSWIASSADGSEWKWTGMLGMCKKEGIAETGLKVMFVVLGALVVSGGK